MSKNKALFGRTSNRIVSNGKRIVKLRGLPVRNLNELTNDVKMAVRVDSVAFTNKNKINDVTLP